VLPSVKAPAKQSAMSFGHDGIAFFSSATNSLVNWFLLCITLLSPATMYLSKYFGAA